MTGWRTATLGNVIELQRGYDLPESERRPGIVPVCGSAGINGYHDTARAPSPGVTVGRSGASIGVVTFVREPYWPHNAVLFVKDFKGNDPKFIAALLQRARLAELNSGSAQPSLNRNFVYHLQVRIPPLDVQRRIAGILSAYDDLIEVNARRIAVLEEMASRLFDEWFVKFDFPGAPNTKFAQRVGRRAPDGWSLRPFSDAADVFSGGTPRKAEPSFWDGAIPFFTPSDARQRTFATETAEHITAAGLAKCASELFEPWTVFITARGTVGRVLFAAEPMAMNQSCYALRGKGGYPQTFIYELARQAAAAFNQMAHGAVFDTIVKDTFDKHEVLLPPALLAKRYDEISRPIYESALIHLRQNSGLRAARDLLLPKLISGEIDLSGAERQTKRAVKRAAAE